MLEWFVDRPLGAHVGFAECGLRPHGWRLLAVTDNVTEQTGLKNVIQDHQMSAHTASESWRQSNSSERESN